MSIGLSVIIPAYNEEKYLPKTLESIRCALQILKRVEGVNGEIIVVDNESKDQTAAVAQGLGARVIPFAIHNISAVCNEGVRHALGQVICKVDADSLVSENAFLRIWQTMQTGKFVGGGVQIRFHQPRPWIAFGAKVVLLFYTIMGVSMGMMFARKDYFTAIGGFPEDYFAGEDSEFCLRLKKFGKKNQLRFSNLKDVYILSADRKRSFGALQQLKIYGMFILSPKIRRDKSKLGFWYDPER